ncbi:hypothetical protein D5F01_LYC11219 [Larimichthys crocea]|uniref:Sterile alpha motif domain-containing protein 3 n=1 Tax=Larimichthys crocea TaxID=215358 RepID=A0A6G0IDT8_LARCR|nr:hypothetical protein D5F01_LYC11219 [Larimichthys crocea]
MAGSTPARLKVILGENNIEKLTLPNGIPESLEDLLGTIKTTFGLKDILRLQYMDQDFGNDFFNLNSTTELQNLGTIKVIHQQTNPPLISDLQSTSSLSISFESDDGASGASNDTIIVSSPESVSSRTQQWPEDFAIPQFSYDTELQLERGNTEYRVSQKMLTLSSRMLSDILKRVAEEIYRYKAYPEDAHFCTAAEALIKRHPCLKEPGSFNGCYGWKQRLKYKMANYRTQLKLQGCPELCVNSLKSKATTDTYPAKKVKKPKRSEANFYPSFPTGETLDSMEKVRLELLTEIGIRDNERVIENKMANTFAYRRHEVVNQEPSIQELKDRWPALFTQKEINTEFQRLMAVPLEGKFMAQLDMHSSQLIKVIRAKGGATRQKIANIMDTLDQTVDINHRRECVLKALTIFLGEDADGLIKEYLDCGADDVQRDLGQVTMAVFVIRKEGEGLQDPPADIGIVIEGVEVLHELTSVASACALLLDHAKHPTTNTPPYTAQRGDSVAERNKATQLRRRFRGRASSETNSVETELSPETKQQRLLSS